ncbi:1347_t:CDS:2, partial [Gigaspora rosea]
MPKNNTIGYYAVRIGREPGIFISWKEYKKQIDRYPGAWYKKFYTKQQVSEYIEEENVDETDKVKIYTDGYCKKNGTDDAETSIGVFFNDNDLLNSKSKNELIKRLSKDDPEYLIEHLQNSENKKEVEKRPKKKPTIYNNFVKKEYPNLKEEIDNSSEIFKML